MFGIYTTVGVAGRMIMFKLTSTMFNEYGRHYPMLIVGCGYVGYSLIMAILALCGKWEKKIP